MSTILIADDDPGHLTLFRDVLQADGHAALTAENGDQAMELALSGAPDLILMDVQMGESGGAEALVALRQDIATRSIPIIAVTALAMEGDEARLLALGFDYYLSKPVDLATLRAIVRRCLNPDENGGART